MNDVDDFLEHHGIKGMRWGSRKNTSSGQGNKTSTKKKFAVTVGLATAAAGAVAIDHLLRKNNGLKISKIQEVEHWRRVEQTGIAWLGQNGKMNYGLPGQLLTPENRAALKKAGSLTF